mmetsp:Transcript_32399/g.71910  ORF Transcript_32399/g.71910 Transcript_32399/m.71910 type:complete len:266 (+) Transcript_32399:1446-2243(+)
MRLISSRSAATAAPVTTIWCIAGGASGALLSSKRSFNNGALPRICASRTGVKALHLLSSPQRSTMTVSVLSMPIAMSIAICPDSFGILGLDLASRSTFTMPGWPSSAATQIGVALPFLSRRIASKSGPSERPVLTNKCTTSVFASQVAILSASISTLAGVSHEYRISVRLSFSKTSTTAACAGSAVCEVIIKGVKLGNLVRGLTSALAWPSRTCTTSACPERAAQCRAVCPERTFCTSSSVVRFTSMPGAASKQRTTALCPALAA